MNREILQSLIIESVSSENTSPIVGYLQILRPLVLKSYFLTTYEISSHNYYLFISIISQHIVINEDDHWVAFFYKQEQN
jgi:hypothetical protein